MTNEPIIDIPFGQLSQRDAVGLLAPYTEERATAKAAADRRDSIGVIIKGWLEEHPGETLRDGEAGLEARLQSRHGTERYDVRGMVAELVLTLAAMGALEVNVRVIRALEGKAIVAEDVKPHRIPGGETVSFVVKQK